MLALVDDDSRAMRMVLRRILVERGVEVVEATDGRQALDLETAGPVPDLALVDGNVPVMDEHSQIVRALAAGAHEHVLGPFTAEAITDELSLLGLTPAA